MPITIDDKAVPGVWIVRVDDMSAGETKRESLDRAAVRARERADELELMAAREREMLRSDHLPDSGKMVQLAMIESVE